MLRRGRARVTSLRRRESNLRMACISLWLKNAGDDFARGIPWDTPARVHDQDLDGRGFASGFSPGIFLVGMVSWQLVARLMRRCVCAGLCPLYFRTLARNTAD